MKKTRTLEDYKELGALLRLLYSVATDAEVFAGGMFPIKEMKKLTKLVDTLVQIKSDFDGKLFTDFPDIGKPGTHVFYGDLGREPMDDVDKDVMGLARAYVAALFGE